MVSSRDSRGRLSYVARGLAAARSRGTGVPARPQGATMGRQRPRPWIRLWRTISVLHAYSHAWTSRGRAARYVFSVWQARKFGVRRHSGAASALFLPAEPASEAWAVARSARDQSGDAAPLCHRTPRRLRRAKHIRGVLRGRASEYLQHSPALNVMNEHRTLNIQVAEVSSLLSTFDVRCWMFNVRCSNSDASRPTPDP